METKPRNNKAPEQQPFLQAFCHNVRPEKYHLLTDMEMRALYAHGLEHLGVWPVVPTEAEIRYMVELGLEVPTPVAA